MKKRTSAYKPAFTMRASFFVYTFVATSKPEPLHSIKWITELACKPYPPSALPLNASTAWFAYKPSWTQALLIRKRAARSSADK
jgi:hypothetical protein